mmetsp:Transcript_22707/g.53065  ORF Transcript_22707/g.53065 Transcript_22707/m.53065 type:complete len:228 (+) Transcript_22707:67-750(+)
MMLHNLILQEVQLRNSILEASLRQMERRMASMQVRLHQDLARIRTQHHAAEPLIGADINGLGHARGVAYSDANNIRGNWASHMGGMATSVIDGDVYVNGQWVATVPVGQPASVQQADGVVRLNGEVIWVRRDLRKQQRALAEARHSSLLTESAYDREDPCPVCLESIRRGQLVRTLPCFHVLHGHCAEEHFRASVASSTSPGGARRGTPQVLCPLCRTQVASPVPRR